MDGELGFVIGAMEVNPEIRLELVIDDFGRLKYIYIYIYITNDRLNLICVCVFPYSE